MFDNWRWLKVVALVALAGLALAACSPTPPVVQPTTGPGETPAPPGITNPDPTTFTVSTFGEPESLDPNLTYETAGGAIEQNVYEGLVFYNRQFADQFIPQLATSWEVSDDGTTWTFTIREGVTFHGGETLDPGDVEYAFERGLLMGGTSSPQWLLTEPFLGIGTYDIAEAVDPSGALDDDPAGLQAFDPAALLAACQRVTDAITSDAAAGTVTFHLAQAWGPFLPTIAQTWGSVYDSDWAKAQGTWDGDCATWQNFYGVDAETTPLAKVMNGTGPFWFDHWTPGEEIVLNRNDNYWRTEPMWEGGPSGPAFHERIVELFVDEWGTRFAQFQAGDIDAVVLPSLAVLDQLLPDTGVLCAYNGETFDFDCAPNPDNPDGPFIAYHGYPTVVRTDGLMTFEMNTEGGNPYIGSGALDGAGVPPDFFSDIDVRLAFNYCFDWDTYIADAFNGYAVQTVGFLIPGMPGYNPDGPKYTFDLAQCQAHIEAAWGGAVAENGFRLQAGYNIGNEARRTAIEILSNNFQSIDTKYSIESVGLPWPTFLASLRAARLPLAFSGWLEDIHDPHNWGQPFLVGTYASRQRLPQEFIDRYSAQLDAGVAATDPAERAVIYEQLQEQDYADAIAIRLAVATGWHFHQRWVTGWYYNPIYPGAYHYADHFEE